MAGIKKSVPGFDRKQQAMDRRTKMKLIIADDGFHGISKLRKSLIERFGITVTRQTIYTDLANLGGIKEEDMQKLDIKVTSYYESMLSKLQKMTENPSLDEKTRIMAMNAFFRGSKDAYSIMNSIAMRTRGTAEEGGQIKKPSISIRIGDAKVIKRKGEIEDER